VEELPAGRPGAASAVENRSSSAEARGKGSAAADEGEGNSARGFHLRRVRPLT